MVEEIMPLVKKNNLIHVSEGNDLINDLMKKRLRSRTNFSIKKYKHRDRHTNKHKSFIWFEMLTPRMTKSKHYQWNVSIVYSPDLKH